MSIMPATEEFEGAGGEIIRAESVPMSALESLTRAEIDSQIATAKRYPRSIKRFMDDARTLACLTPEVAQSCIYAKPTDGKVLEGPSVRLAEIVAHCFGNLRVVARISQESATYLVAQATALDLERNYGVQIEVRRQIVYKGGKRFSDNMVNTTANAALSIAYRNAVWKCVPAALVSPIYREARKLAAGGGKSIEERRQNVREWIKSIGVRPEELFAFLAVKGWEDISLEHMAILAGIMTGINDGETTAEEVFRPARETPAIEKSRRIGPELQTALHASKKKDREPVPVSAPADAPTGGPSGEGWELGRE